MKRLVIIVEGDTESEFVKKLLAPYLNRKGFYDIRAFKIKHSKGGLTKYKHLETDIINVIQETDVVVTTLIDYYALPPDFPRQEEAQKITDINKRVDFLELSIKEAIESVQKREFRNLFPYIQLHEFEALCFSSFKGFEDNFTEDEANYTEIKKIINAFNNPELINDGKETAPSKRLKNLITGYNKVVYGTVIIESNDIQSVIDKCPRFKQWVERIIVHLSD